MTAIVGASGAIGRALVDEWQRRSIRPVVLARDAARFEALFSGRAEIRAARPGTAGGSGPRAGRCPGSGLLRGASLSPVCRASGAHGKALEAARRAGVRRMIVVTSVYSSGHPRAARVSEDPPREPETRKGRFRKGQEDAAMEAHSPGLFETLVLHLPDFYGPYAANSLAFMMFEPLMQGRAARWLGDPDAPHEFVFLPDAAYVIAELLARLACFGRRWNLAGAGAISGREFAALAARELGVAPRVLPTGRLMLRLGGLFRPLLRELVEPQYLGETPVLLDDSALAAEMGGIPKTPYPEAVRQMTGWVRSGRG